MKMLKSSDVNFILILAWNLETNNSKFQEHLKLRSYLSKEIVAFQKNIIHSS